MFEGIVASVLNKVLGAYVANLETNQLNIGIWKGDVTLHNLKLRTEALDRFDLPLDVTSGYIGELVVKIPWTDLKNQPFLIELKDVLLLAVNRAETNYDADLEKRRKLASKMAKLEMAESMSSQLQQSSKLEKSEETEAQKASFTTQLLTKIMDNLQISITTLHIRYEDTISNAHRIPFTIGVTLKSVSAISNHSPPNTSKLDMETPEPGDIRKLLTLEELSVYLRLRDQLVGSDKQTMLDLGAKLKAIIGNGGVSCKNGQFVLEPVSGHGHITLHRSLKAARAKTKIVLQFDQLAFSLDEDQYQTILQLAEMVTLYVKNQQYRFLRPTNSVSPKDDPLRWFRYAAECVIADVHEKNKVWTWSFIKDRRDKRRLYTSMYIKLRKGVLDAVGKESLKQLDENLSYQDIRFYRSLANQQYRAELAQTRSTVGIKPTLNSNDTASTVSSTVGGWVSSWWSGKGRPQSPVASDKVDDLPESISEEEVKKLYEAIEFDPSVALRNASYPTDALLAQVDFQLTSGSFSIKPSSSREADFLLKFDYSDSRISFIKKPESFQVNVQLQTTRLTDGTTPNTLYPQLVRAKSKKYEDSEANSPSGKPFFYLEYEQNPPMANADHALFIKMLPLEVVWNRVAVLAVKKFFTPLSDSEAMRVLWSVAENTFEGLKTQTRASLEYAISEHKMVDLKLQIDAPVFLFPDSVTDPNAHLVVLDAGKLVVRSELVDKDKKTELQRKEGTKLTPEDWENLYSLLYDKFNCSLTSAQLVVGRNLETCMQCIASAASPFSSSDDLNEGSATTSTPFHVIDRVNLNLQIQLCIVNNEASLSNIKIFGNLPRIHINLSDLKWKAVMGTLEQVLQTLNDKGSPKVVELEAYKKEGPMVRFAEGDRKSPVSIRSLLRRAHSVSSYASSSSETDDFTDALDESPTFPVESLNSAKNFETPNLPHSSATGTMQTPDCGKLRPDSDSSRPLNKRELESPGLRASDAAIRQQEELLKSRTLVEFKFEVDEVSAAISKGFDEDDTADKVLSEMKARKMTLVVEAKPYELKVDFEVGNLDVLDKVLPIPAEKEALFKYLITSECVIQAEDMAPGGVENVDCGAEQSRKSLAHVVFVKYDKESPNYSGVDGNLDIQFADLDVLLNRESILAIYDWIMTTFVPNKAGGLEALDSYAGNQRLPASELEGVRLQLGGDRKPGLVADNASSVMTNLTSILISNEHKLINGVAGSDPTMIMSDKKLKGEALPTESLFIIINFSLSSLNILAHKGYAKLAAGQLEDGHVCVTVNRDSTVHIEGELGNIMVFDEKSQKQNCLLQLEKTQQQAHFVFSNCAGTPESRDFDSSFQLYVPSMRLFYMQDLIIELAEFFSDFARMHALLEAARQAAQAGAATIQETAGSRLKLDIAVETPIIEFPRVQFASDDVVVAYLGELSLKNNFVNSEGTVCTFDITLENIKLMSRFFINGEWCGTNIVQDLTVKLHGKQSNEFSRPFLSFEGSLTDVVMSVNERQYSFLREFLENILANNGAAPPSTLAGKSLSTEEVPSTSIAATPGPRASDTPSEAGRVNFDLSMSLPSLEVSLIRGQGLSNNIVHESALSKFTVHKANAKVAVGPSIDVEVAVRAFQVQDIRPEYDGLYREVLPVVSSVHDQLLVKYHQSSGGLSPPDLSIDLDSPKLMLMVDHVIPLIKFVTQPSFYVPFQDASYRKLDSNSPGVDSPALKSESGFANLPQAPQAPPLNLKVNLVDFEVALLADGRKKDTEAIILASHRVCFELKMKSKLEVCDMGVFVCVYSKRKSTQLRVISNFQLFVKLSQQRPQLISVVEAELSPLVVRVSYKDVLLCLSIGKDVSERLSAIWMDKSNPETVVKDDNLLGTTGEAEVLRRLDDVSGGENQNSTSYSWVCHEKASFSASSVRFLLIDDLMDIQIPMLDCNLDQFTVLVEDWSSNLTVDAGMALTMNYFNIQSSAWEPVVEQWECSLHVARKQQAMEVEFFSRKKLEINVTYTLIASVVSTIDMISKLETAKSIVDDKVGQKKPETRSGADGGVNTASSESEAPKQEGLRASPEKPLSPIDFDVAAERGIVEPYILRNETGYTLHIWSESLDNSESESLQNSTNEPGKLGSFQESSSSSEANNGIHVLLNGETMKWRFEDWIAMREATEPKANRLAIQVEGPPFETLKNVGIDKVGEHVYVLRPKLSNVAHRLVCSVSLENYVRYVTFRSGTLIRNGTRLDIDVRTFSNSTVYTIEPGKSCSIPIIAAYKDRIQLRPSAMFGYGWTNWDNSLFWADMQKPRYSAVVECRSPDVNVPAFRFQVCTELLQSNVSYPLLTFHLFPPLRIENLLPHDIRYIVFDKTARHDYRDVLSQGEADPIHTINPLNTLGLSIDIPHTDFHPSEAAIISSEDRDFRDSTIVVYDSQRRPLELQLNYMDNPHYGGRRVSVYAPYVLVNKTTLQLLFRAKSIVSSSKLAAGQTVGSGFSTDLSDEKDTTATPIMFSYTNFQPLQSRAQVRVPESGWSAPISFEAVGSSYECIIPTATLGLFVHLGVSITEGSGIYYLTKVVTFVPRFVIVNKVGASIQVRQHGTSAGITVPNGKSRPLLYLVDTTERQFCLRLTSTVDEWSAPVNLEDMGRVYVKLNKLGGKRQEQLVSAEISIEGACIFVVISRDENTTWPFTIENASDIPIIFHQKDVNEPRYRYCVEAHSSINYAWDFPSLRHKSIVLIVGSRSRETPITEIGPLYPFDLKKQGVLALDVIVRGKMLVLRLSPYQADKSIYRRASNFDSDGRQRSSMSLQRSSTGSLPSSGGYDDDQSGRGTKGFEVVDASEENKVNFTFQIRLEGIGVSLIDSRQRELIYATFKGVDFTFRDIALYQTLGLRVKWIQIDNQTPGSVEPILLYPTVVPSEGKDVETLPIVQAAIVRSKDESYGVQFFKYFTCLVQELSIVTDEDLLFSLINFSTCFSGLQNVKFSSASDEEQELPTMCSLKIDWKLDRPPKVKGTPLYFEIFQIQPIKLNVSFSRTEQVEYRYNSLDGKEGERSKKTGGILHVIFDVLTMTVGSIHDAPLRLTSLVVEHPFVSNNDLIDLILQHYAQQAMGQLHKVLGSADFLGNPVGLFNTISSGVSDMFYEPLQGFVSDRPQDLGIGLAKGTASFMKKTVYGFSDTFSKFTGSVGKGLSVATLDRDFQEKRRIAKTRNRPKHAMYGVSVGITSLARSMGSAISGVVVQPMEGAEREGFGGFFKGVGKGLVGAVTKPVVGVLDLATSVTEGIKNTTTVFERDLDPVRYPRFVDGDGILRPYNAREALGLSWARTVDNGKYATDPYVAHLELHLNGLVSIALKTRLILARMRKLTVEWVVSYDEIQTVKLVGAYNEMPLNQLGKYQSQVSGMPKTKTRSSSIVSSASVAAALTLSESGHTVMVPSQDSDNQDPVELFIYLLPSSTKKELVAFRKLVFSDVSSAFWFKTKLEKAIYNYNEERRPLE